LARNGLEQTDLPEPFWLKADWWRDSGGSAESALLERLEVALHA